MADEVEPEVKAVPEQGEMFRQGIMPDEPVAAPPAPEPEPAAEPEAPPVEPDWLSAPEVPPQAAPPQQYYEPPPQYPQQPQAPPQAAPRGDAALEAFVDNPDGWFNQRMAAREQQMLAPMQQQTQAVQNMMGMMMDNQVKEHKSRVDDSVRRAYNSFNQDATFRSSKAMQDKIGATLSGMRDRAEFAARNGDFGPMNALSNLTEADIAGTLAYVRAASGVQSPGVAPLQVEGATVESSRSAVDAGNVVLTADQEAAAARLGPGGRDRLIQGIADAEKYDDFEVKE